MEQSVEQRTQAVIDFNKMLDQLPAVLSHLTEEQKQELADSIATQKQILGL